MSIDVWIYFWVFSSIPFVPISCCFSFYSFVIHVGDGDNFHSPLLFWTVLAILRVFLCVCFHMKLKTVYCSAGNETGELDLEELRDRWRSAVNLSVSLIRVACEVPRAFLLELGAWETQWVGGRRLGGEDLWDPLVMEVAGGCCRARVRLGIGFGGAEREVESWGWPPCFPGQSLQCVFLKSNT